MQYVDDVIARFPTVRMWVYSFLATLMVTVLAWFGSTLWIADVPARIALGEGDASYFSGWHEAEESSAVFDWQIGRWSGLNSTVHIPTTTQAWQVVELVLTNQYIDGSTLIPVMQWRSVQGSDAQQSASVVALGFARPRILGQILARWGHDSGGWACATLGGEWCECLLCSVVMVDIGGHIGTGSTQECCTASKTW